MSKGEFKKSPWLEMRTNSRGKLRDSISRKKDILQKQNKMGRERLGGAGRAVNSALKMYV